MPTLRYIPAPIVMDPWSTPISIEAVDYITELDDAVNQIMTDDPQSLMIHFNEQMAKLPPYLTNELTKLKDEIASTILIPDEIVKQTSPTGAAILPTGTTIERDPVPKVGYIRYNTDTGMHEIFTATGWEDNSALYETLDTYSGRNILIDGEVGRINQSGFDGNWANVALSTYGYDVWRRNGANNIEQIVEEGNYKPNSVYTLSGNEITTQQETSPASGIWYIGGNAIGEFQLSIPNTATNVQLELGTVATPFEILPYSDQLARAQRYYERVEVKETARRAVGNYQHLMTIQYAKKRELPTVIYDISGSDITNIGEHHNDQMINFYGDINDINATTREGHVEIDARL